MTRAWAVLAVLLATPAWASEGLCQSDARNLQRDMIYNGSQLPPSDRMVMERRLNNAERMCDTNPRGARSDLQNLQRDMTQQAQRPLTPPAGGGSWAEPRGGSWE